MIDKMKPIKGYFKVEKIDENGKVLDTYEDKNTVMARIPELYAGQCSGYFAANIDQYTINSFAIGTGGTKVDGFGNVIPLSVADTRTQLFSEENFWNEDTRDTNLIPAVIPDVNKRVHQSTWTTTKYGDLNQNTSAFRGTEAQNEGSTLPRAVDGGGDILATPENYRGILDTTDGHHVEVDMSLVSNVITYKVEVGQFVANDPSDIPVEYSEAALYLKFLSNNVDKAEDPQTGNSLGQLFSMKTFPPQFKNSTCSLRIIWKLYF